MRIFKINGHDPIEESKEPIPFKIDMWYFRQEHYWVVQLKDEEGNQIGEAKYVYSKPEALNEVEYLKKTYGLSE